MTAAIANDDGDSKIDPNPGSTERIDYTVTLGNTTGSDATNLSFSDTLDPHTALVAGSVNGTPVAFDQSVTTNEDTAKIITLVGQDPDGSAVTFSIVTPPPVANGSLGSLGAPDCATTPGICTATVTYTP